MGYIVEILVKIVMIGAIPLLLFMLFEPVTVVGHSMNPNIHHGDILLISKVFYRYTLNDIYIYKSPKSGHEVVKRLFEILPPDPIISQYRRLYFLGDNAEYSLDSRDYGFIEEKNVVGKVIFHVRSNNDNKNRRKKND